MLAFTIFDVKCFKKIISLLGVMAYYLVSNDFV